jgi:hypothetical protein
LLEASLLRRGFVTKVLSEEIEDVFKAKNVFGRRFAKRFVRFEHRLGLLSLSGIRALASGRLFERFAFRCTSAIAMDIEYLIQSKTGKKLLASIAAMNNVKVAAPEFLEAQGHTGHRSHECGIHHRAIRQIYYKFAIPAV